jgi:hypothetical protein
MTITIASGTIAPDKPAILWNNVFNDGTVTVSSETADGAGANALEETTFDFWIPSAVLASISVDLGSARICDAAGIAAHTIGSTGASVEVQSSDNGATWVTRAASTPSDNETILILFPAVSARYWRILLTGAVAAIGVVKLGRRLIIPTGVLSGHVGLHHAREIELLTNQSIKGQFLGNRIIKMGAETDINFGLMDVEFVENDMAEFERHYNEGGTFFYAGSPSRLPKDVGYCWRQERAGSMRPSYDEGSTLMNVSIQVAAYVDQ